MSKKMARIYLPSKTATQSGRRNTKLWVLEYEADGTDYINPLMEWNASKNTEKQVVLQFASREDAERYASERDLFYKILPSNQLINKRKSYLGL